LWKNDKLF